MVIGRARPRARIRWAETATGYALVAVPLAVLCVLVLMPATVAVVETVLVAGPDGTRLGLDRYVAFFDDAFARRNLIYSVLQTAASTATVLAIALAIAVYLRFGQGRAVRVVQALALFPLFVPAIIAAYALVRFLGPNGLFQMLLERIGITGYASPYLTPLGPFVGFVWDGLPLPVLVLTAGLAQVSDHAIEAARDLGAGGIRIFREILLPQVARSLMIACSLVFLGIFGSYTIPYMMGPAAPEMMGVFMQRTYDQLQRPQDAQVQAVVSFLVCALVSIAYVRLILTERR
jgi:putative spermidine/putrescine transport system permease protein